MISLPWHIWSCLAPRLTTCWIAGPAYLLLRFICWVDSSTSSIHLLYQYVYYSDSSEVSIDLLRRWTCCGEAERPWGCQVEGVVKNGGLEAAGQLLWLEGSLTDS